MRYVYVVTISCCMFMHRYSGFSLINSTKDFIGNLKRKRKAWKWYHTTVAAAAAEVTCLCTTYCTHSHMYYMDIGLQFGNRNLCQKHTHTAHHQLFVYARRRRQAVIYSVWKKRVQGLFFLSHSSNKNAFAKKEASLRKIHSPIYVVSQIKIVYYILVCTMYFWTEEV